jgi:hypothetical protein
MNPEVALSRDTPDHCLGCLYDAGCQSGMVGACRCDLLETAQDGAIPLEWSFRRGQWHCARFEAGLEMDFLEGPELSFTLVPSCAYPAHG